MKRFYAVVATTLLLVVSFGEPAVGAPVAFTPGAPTAGDPYFPLDGNGGYDVASYDLAVRYHPPTDQLTGLATISALATQNLSRFNLDLDGLTVRSISVDGQPATFSRAFGELLIVPDSGLRAGRPFTTIIRYDGIPRTLPDGSGFIHTDDGALVVGEPDVASTWFPVNGSTGRPSRNGTSCSSRLTRPAPTTGQRCPISSATRARRPGHRAPVGNSCTRS